jgi:hypothetical protein
MIKKIFITTVIGTIAYYLFGWLVFDFILGNYTNLNTTQLTGFKKTEEQFSMLLLIVSCTAYACLLSFILVYLLNVKQLIKAFMIGSTVGILVAIMTDSYWFATSHFYSNYTVMFLDILAAGISVGVLGLVIALTNKKLS